VIPFYTHFSDLAAKETRNVTLRGHPGLPDGEYGLIEFYCDEPACDCRRVILRVVAAPPDLRTYATINYGWESLAFYTQWVHGNARLAAQIQGASLEVFGEQSPFADAFLQLIRLLLQDSAYVQRLQRHYWLFKEAVRAQVSATRLRAAGHRPRRRRHRRAVGREGGDSSGANHSRRGRTTRAAAC